MSDQKPFSRRDVPSEASGNSGDQSPDFTTDQILQDLQVAVEEVRDVVFITTPEGEITYVNQAFERIYGFSREEALGKNPRILKSTLLSGEYYKQFWEGIQAGEAFQDEHLNRRKDGRLVHVSSIVQPILNGKGEITSFVAVQHDNFASDELRKLKETLHTVIDSSVADLILEKRLLTEKRRASVLLTGLADFAQFSAQRRPEIVITDLNRLLQEIEGVLFEYHSHIDRHLGDGIMAEFGVPIDYDRHALLAVVSGLKLQERMVRGGFPWKMRVSISTGELIMGLVGHRRQTYTAFGEVVDRTSRIHQVGVPGIVTVGPTTFEEVRPFVNARRRTVFLHSENEDPEFIATVNHYLTALDETPRDAALLKEVGLLLVTGGYIRSAHVHLREALEVNPDDTRVKLAYAETVLSLNKLGEGESVWQENLLHLYEVLELVNPLRDPEKIPPTLYTRYADQVDNSFEYPEDMILPAEAIDGSVGHSRMVGFLAYAIADEMSFTQEAKLDLLKAGYFADLGKQTVSHHILNRAGSLSDKEFEAVTKHPSESVRILKEADLGNPAIFETILASHEHFNGTGYPSRLSGEGIPMSARILALADTYSGLTSWRPYRAGWERGAAWAEIRRETERGRFDPAVVEASGRLLSV